MYLLRFCPVVPNLSFWFAYHGGEEREACSDVCEMLRSGSDGSNSTAHGSSNLHIIKYTIALPFDLSPSPPPACIPTSVAVSAMAEAHPTSAATAEAQPIHGHPWQKDVDEIKQEIRDLRTMFGSLVEKVEVLGKVKMERVSGVRFQLSPLSSRIAFATPDQPSFRSSARQGHPVDPLCDVSSCSIIGSASPSDNEAYSDTLHPF